MRPHDSRRSLVDAAVFTTSYQRSRKKRFVKAYLDLVRHIRDYGTRKEDRTGTGTISIFGHQIRFDLAQGFPLVTSKKVHLKSILHELLWFIRGDTNIRYLVENGVGIWNDWPYQSWLRQTGQDSDLVMYSPEWKAGLKTFEGVDQLAQLVEEIKSNPDSRRLMVSAWNPKDIPVMVKSGLPPCHSLFQFYVTEGRLSCQLYQRSADVFLGVPFNIASYALLTLMIAQVTGLKPGEFVHTFGDAHLYSNHMDQVEEQLSRTTFSLPTLVINPDVDNLFDFVYEDFELQNYQSHGAISAPVAV